MKKDKIVRVGTGLTLLDYMKETGWRYLLAIVLMAGVQTAHQAHLETLPEAPPKVNSIQSIEAYLEYRRAIAIIQSETSNSR